MEKLGVQTRLQRLIHRNPNIVKDLSRGTFHMTREALHFGYHLLHRGQPRAILSCRYTMLYIALDPFVWACHAAGSPPCFLGLITRRMIRAAMMSRSKKMIFRLVVFF